MVPFTEFPKIARLRRECVITEKLDGTSAQVHVTEDGVVLAGSRTRWITRENDNYGFAEWAWKHEDQLVQLGPGSHYGEWWGAGIQRRYNVPDKRFSLFNVARWGDAESRPACCGVVPVLARGVLSDALVEGALEQLRTAGSAAAPGFMRPEGIVLWHDAAQKLFKVTLEKDEEPKGKAAWLAKQVKP